MTFFACSMIRWHVELGGILRKCTSLLTIAFLLATLLLTGVTPASAATPSSGDPFIAKVLQLTNQYRAANGARPVVWNQAIAGVSQQWAEVTGRKINSGTLDMATIHRSDGGGSLIPRGADWYSEIIAINNSAQQVVDWWMTSPAHRAALLDGRVTDVGIGYARTTAAGWGAYAAVENFAGYAGHRTTAPAAPVSPVPVMQGIRPGDIAAIDPAGSVYVYPSTGGGDVWQRRYLAGGGQGARQADVVDWNSDGRQDLIIVWASGNVSVSHGQANGTLGAAQRIGDGGWGDYDITVTRWSKADKYPTILAKNNLTGDLFWYQNPSGSAIGSRTRIGAGGWSPLSIVALDYDGDGRMDLLAKNPQGLLLLYRSNGAGAFVEEPRQSIDWGWDMMNFTTSTTSHLGDGKDGILARSQSGSLYFYPVSPNRINAGMLIGRDGWNSMLIGG